MSDWELPIYHGAQANGEDVAKSANSEWRIANYGGVPYDTLHHSNGSIFIVAMIVFLGFALSGRWTDLGIALVITGVLWYTLVPEYHSGRQ